jgi:4-amino-4-deoxy-L-arabinose transferase-like glycosyltransferase
MAALVTLGAWLLACAQLAIFALYQPIWSPVDEFSHFFNVNYFAYTHHPPALQVVFEATTNPRQPAVLSIPPSRGRGIPMSRFNHANEALQPPLYYGLMVPAFLTRPHGTYSQVIAVRLATAALAALLIPLTFFAARLAVPTVPWVWAAASVTPLLSRGYLYNSSQVTNDALAIAVGGVALLAFLWLLRARLDWRWGTVAGLVVGVAVLTKVTVYFIPVVLALLFLARVIRAPHRGALTAAVVGVAVSAGLSLAWLALEYQRYHSLMPPAQSGPMPAALLPYYHLPLIDALRVIVVRGVVTFWGGEFGGAYAPLWLMWAGQGALILCLLGFGRPALWRLRPLPAANWVFVWGAVGLATLLGIVLLSQVAILLGRYVYPLFPAIALSWAVGANQLGRVGRWLFIGGAGLLLITAVIALPPVLSWSLGDCRTCAIPLSQ